MNLKFITSKICLFSIVILFLSLFIFGRNSFGFLYFLGNTFAILTSMGLLLYTSNRISLFSTKIFYRKLFFSSFIFRTFPIIIIYFILQSMSSGDIGIEEYDTVFYDSFARYLANYYKSGLFNADVKSFLEFEFDDKGYIFILSFVYFLFDNLLFAKIVQGLFDTFSVLLIYKIARKIYNEQIARIAGILSSVFLPFIVISSLHTKEVYMTFFLLLSIYYTIKINNHQYNFKNFLVLFLSIIALFSMRLILGIIVLISILYYLFVNQNRSYFAKIILPIIILFTFFGTLKYINADDQIMEKLGGYLGYENSEEIMIGGRSAEEIERGGQGYAKYASYLLLLPQVIITPYPSIVRTNIKMYNTTMQWFFAGGLFIWSYLSFFAFIGIYQTLKFNFKKTSIVTIILSLYILVVVYSFYITSIRFNIPKLVLLIFFTAVGINHKFINKNKYFLIYVIFISIIILSWNYIKLAGRGMV